MALSVIGAGMGRTGTMSLKVALEMLGFAPCCHLSTIVQTPSLWSVWGDIIDGKSRDWDSVFGTFKAAVDAPAWFYYRELAAFYPDAKIILTVRDASKWFESTQETVMSDAMGEMLKNAPPPLYKIVHSTALRSAGDKMHERDHVIGWFERHNAEVTHVIPRERLLVYEVAQGWAPLCQFLNVPVPKEPFPRVNERAQITAMVSARSAAGDPASDLKHLQSYDPSRTA